jgi:UDP-N-acetylglucosamine:LPS N-acetylglucosamine transferase
MSTPPPIVTAVDMGYGHLRAAHALADALGTEVARADLPPFASPGERRLWRVARAGYEAVSRGSQQGPFRPLLHPVLEALTRIGPLEESAGPEATNGGARSPGPPAALTALLRRGVGTGPAEAAARAGVPLLATYFVPSLAADHLENGEAPPATFCLVTDADLARAWVAAEPAASGVRYLAPSLRAKRRLLRYGVPKERVAFTRFPLPGELLGGPELPALHRNLDARLARLDRSGGDGGGRRPVHLVYTVGGAGAQAEIARAILDGLRPLIEAGELRLTLVAGVRTEVAERFRNWVEQAKLEDAGVEVLIWATPGDYFRAFNAILATADLLWTKPSEVTFFAALGLPLLLAPPVGAHERYNREWLLENGAALQPDRERIGPWLRAKLADGSLARAAEAGAERLPKRGLYRIVERVAGGA